jgi:hypothetical protein
MIHAAGMQDRIVHADGHTGTKQRIQYNGRQTRGYISREEAYPIPVFRVDNPHSCFSSLRPCKKIFSDMQVLDSAAVLSRMGTHLKESIHCAPSIS